MKMKKNILLFLVTLFLFECPVFSQISGRVPVISKETFDKPIVYLVKGSNISARYDIVQPDSNRWLIRGADNKIFRVIFLLEKSKEKTSLVERDNIYVCLAGTTTGDNYYNGIVYFRGATLDKINFPVASKFEFLDTPNIIDLSSPKRYDETYWKYDMRESKEGKLPTSDVDAISLHLPAVIKENDISTSTAITYIPIRGNIYNRISKKIEYSEGLRLKDITTHST
jgi:hypothetical protein